jgi:hypothetical protein
MTSSSKSAPTWASNPRCSPNLRVGSKPEGVPGAWTHDSANPSRDRRRSDRIADIFAAAHMSAFGTKQTSQKHFAMSAFGGKRTWRRPNATSAFDPKQTSRGCIARTAPPPVCRFKPLRCPVLILEGEHETAGISWFSGRRHSGVTTCSARSASKYAVDRVSQQPVG